MERYSINNCDILKFLTSVKDRHFDRSAIHIRKELNLEQNCWDNFETLMSNIEGDSGGKLRIGHMLVIIIFPSR